METFELLDHQYDALASDNKITLLNGGIGSGKSYCGALHALDMSQINPDGIGLIAANTYKQLNDATLATLINILDQKKISHLHKQSKGELYIGRKKFLCRSLENYDKLRGIEISDFWLDETRDTPEEAFKVVLGRLRHPKAKRLRGLLTTSPSGYNWLHDYFVSNIRPGFNLVNASSYDNPFLPEGFIETLKGSYDPRMIDQEIHGKFLNLTAEPVYYSFDRNVQVMPFENENNFPMKIGMDFNVNPMTAVIGWVSNDTVYVRHEAFLKDSNTYKMKQHLIDRGFAGATIFPDSTGRALKTSAAGLTDHLILQQDNIFAVSVVNNPFVGDRYNCVNGLLSKARLVIHPECVNLIKDLEQVSRGKNDEMLTHISDALGYLCWAHFPIQRPTTSRQYKYA